MTSVLRRTPLSAKHGAAVAVFAVPVLVVLMTMVTNATVSAENPHHAGGHLSVALPLYALAFVLWRVSPPARNAWGARLARSLFTFSIVLLATGLAIEALGAFGYDGDASRIKGLTTLHNTAFLIQLPGLLALVLAVPVGVISLFAKIRPGVSAG